jgi:hypothetical protein
MVAYEVGNGSGRLSRLAPLAGTALALRHALGPRRPDQAVEDVLDKLHADWPRLVAAADRLPDHPPDRDAMAVLVVERSSARTVFVFASDATPLLVAKLGDVAVEEAALTRARPARATPAPLGRVAGAFVQEGVPGLPVPLPEVGSAEVLSLRWSPAFRSLGRAVARIGEVTATRTDQAPGELAEPLDAAVADELLPDAVRPAVAAAARDVRRVPVSVLRHGDLSGQNWLVDKGEVTGLVDWETAVDDGVPGFDVLHAAVSWFHHVLARSGASEQSVAAGFEAAWDRSPFFAGARRAALDAAAAVGVPAPLHDSLVVAFFVRRLGRRLRFGPNDARTVTARRMLDAVCR